MVSDARGYEDVGLEPLPPLALLPALLTKAPGCEPRLVALGGEA
jgi:hypothetical protein